MVNLLPLLLGYITHDPRHCTCDNQYPRTGNNPFCFQELSPFENVRFCQSGVPTAPPVRPLVPHPRLAGSECSHHPAATSRTDSCLQDRYPSLPSPALSAPDLL